MKRYIYKKTAFDIIRESLTAIVFTLTIIIMIVFGLWKAEVGSRIEGLRLLEESIMRAIVQCYAIEGIYPESIRYIEERYGVYIDKTRYIVHYDILASNILPNVFVMELSGGRKR